MSRSWSIWRSRRSSWVRTKERGRCWRPSFSLFARADGCKTSVMALEGCALVAAKRGNEEDALGLVAAAAVVRDAMGIPVERDPRVIGPGPTAARTELRRLARAAIHVAVPWSFGEALKIAEAVIASPGSGLGSGDHVGLTPRERDVLRFVVAGRTDRAIADELFISRRTASKHVAAILAKLEVATRAEAAVRAVRDGLV